MEEKDQIVQILSYIDAPQDYISGKSCASYIDKVKGFVEEKKTLEESFSESPSDVRDVLLAMLQFDPK